MFSKDVTEDTVLNHSNRFKLLLPPFPIVILIIHLVDQGYLSEFQLVANTPSITCPGPGDASIPTPGNNFLPSLLHIHFLL